jgi:segregation and condensation protein B
MSLKSKIEAIIYAAEEPVTVDQIVDVLKDVAPEELAPAPEAQPQEQLAEPAADPTSPTNSAAEQATEDGDPPTPDPKAAAKAERAAQRARVRAAIEELIADYDSADRGMQISAIAGGYRMATRPEHHDAVRSFARSLKSPVRLSLQALETLAVIAYKQPVTAPEISEIRGVDSSGVLATLLDRKLITTAGRKAVIGRPILYKTTKDFLVRFGLKDVQELPSMEEFEKMTGDGQSDLFEHTPVADATGVPDAPTEIEDASLQEAEPEQTETSHAGQPEEA